MHVAVCMDQYAYRKHMERLLGRASDQMSAAHGVLFVDTYGSPDSLMHKLRSYDLFFLDLQSSELNGFELMLKLRAAQVTVPIILVTSPEMDYRSMAREYLLSGLSFGDGLLEFLDQPIAMDDLKRCLLFGHRALRDATPTIELRSEKETLYVIREEIIYAEAEGLGSTVTLTGSRQIHVDLSIDNLYENISNHTVFYQLSNKMILNTAYLASIGFCSVTLQNGKKISCRNSVCKELKRLVNM